MHALQWATLYGGIHKYELEYFPQLKSVGCHHYTTFKCQNVHNKCCTLHEHVHELFEFNFAYVSGKNK